LKGEDEAPAIATKTRRDFRATLIIVSALILIAVGRPVVRKLSAHPSRGECRELIDKYALLVAEQAAPPEPVAKTEKRPQPPKPVSEADPEIARCASELTVAEADCAARATNPDAFERCVP
jgi:hypothetical protein